MSADKIDHKEQAGNLLASIHLDTGEVYDQTPEARGLRLALAQLHIQLLMADATTKMAEQTRISNLIAYTTGQHPNGSGISNGEALDDIRDGLAS